MNFEYLEGKIVQITKSSVMKDIMQRRDSQFNLSRVIKSHLWTAIPAYNKEGLIG